MPAFVSPQLSATGPEERAAVREAFAIAAASAPVAAVPPAAAAEPLDWLETSIPRRWRFRGETVEIEWMGPEGPWPFRD
jgi:alpha-galactosidase